MTHVVHTVGTLGDQHGGPSRSITALCSALAQTDVDVELFTLKDRDPASLPILPSSQRVQLHILPGHQASIRSARRLGRQVANALHPGDSVIHEHGMWLPTNHVVARTAYVNHVPRIVSPRGMLSKWALGFRRWKKELAWSLYQRRDLELATVVHVTSEQEGDEVRESGMRQPLAVIPNGIDLPSIAERLPTDDAPRRALFLSRIHPKKGVLELVEAWHRVRPSGWELVIAGPDDERHEREVRGAIERCGLTKSIVLVGAVSDGAKWPLYASADLFVLPTFSENFGIVVAEALASGLPVITTKGAPWAGIERHRCGWWTEIGVEPLERALREATALDPGGLRCLGRRGRDFVLAEFSWGRVSADMKGVYDWMLNRGERPRALRIA